MNRWHLSGIFHLGAYVFAIENDTEVSIFPDEIKYALVRQWDV
jgi:hypothetical protein